MNGRILLPLLEVPVRVGGLWPALGLQAARGPCWGCLLESRGRGGGGAGSGPCREVRHSIGPFLVGLGHCLKSLLAFGVGEGEGLGCENTLFSFKPRFFSLFSSRFSVLAPVKSLNSSLLAAACHRVTAALGAAITFPQLV